ncbi:hypothetical protein GE061_006797 [Apolygus lucorum]|uniref:Uncharacterized protein n=1 Tax=Apolygus lucorum TaxID=248454 RepID=A0A8S9WTP7_APOLU|nr:hypothetical protein GE061_006797 [Apolygus lucorum]
MFARKACSCSRLIHPMSVFRRIIKEMLVRRPLSVKAPFALLEHLPRAFVQGSGSVPNSPFEPSNVRQEGLLVLEADPPDAEYLNSPFKPSNVRPEGLLVLEADPLDVGFTTDHQRDARSSPAQCKSPVYPARAFATSIRTRPQTVYLNSPFEPSNVRPEGLLVLEADPPDVGFPTNHLRDARSSPARCKSPVYTARAFATSIRSRPQAVYLNSPFEPSNVCPEGLLVLEADPPDVSFPTDHQRDARSSPAQCKSPVYTARAFATSIRSRLRQCT